MDVEQPSLGNIGPEAINVALSWSWDRGWRTLVTWRPSGALAFHRTVYEGLDEAELHAVLSDHMADLLGLV